MLQALDPALLVLSLTASLHCTEVVPWKLAEILSAKDIISCKTVYLLINPIRSVFLVRFEL